MDGYMPLRGLERKNTKIGRRRRRQNTLEGEIRVNQRRIEIANGRGTGGAQPVKIGFLLEKEEGGRSVHMTIVLKKKGRGMKKTKIRS